MGSGVFVEAVAVLVAAIFARRVVDRPVPVAPLGQAAVDGILVGVDFRPSGLMVVWRTLSSMRMTTSPDRWIMPKMGGFSVAHVRPSADGGGWPLCPATT